MTSGGDDYFKDPNIIEHKLGKTVLKFDPFPVPGYDATRSAFGDVATAESYDGSMRAKGKNDFTLSLKALMDAFDTFIREYNKNSGVKGNLTGYRDNYDLKNPNDFTIFLIWQIRHILTHNGGCIDQKCKNDYEKAFQEGQTLGTSPAINLPSTLPIGKQFHVNHDQYFGLKTAIFRYIEKKLPDQDLKNLALKSAATNTRISITFSNGSVKFDVKMADLEEKGVPLEFKDGRFSLPPVILDVVSKRLILKNNGVAIPVKLLN